jgi:alkylation response protein AidB-like acyl-CoA dehydrogenase
MEKMMGTVGPRHFNVIFQDLAVPEKNILGTKGKGLDVAFNILGLSRVSIAACCVGVAQKLLDLCLVHVKKRSTFGKPLMTRQAFSGCYEMGNYICGNLFIKRQPGSTNRVWILIWMRPWPNSIPKRW